MISPWHTSDINKQFALIDDVAITNTAEFNEEVQLMEGFDKEFQEFHTNTQIKFTNNPHWQITSL